VENDRSIHNKHFGIKNVNGLVGLKWLVTYPWEIEPLYLSALLVIRTVLPFSSHVFPQPRWKARHSSGTVTVISIIEIVPHSRGVCDWGRGDVVQEIQGDTILTFLAQILTDLLRWQCTIQLH
jgi:hypothetical protein